MALYTIETQRGSKTALPGTDNLFTVFKRFRTSDGQVVKIAIGENLTDWHATLLCEAVEKCDQSEGYPDTRPLSEIRKLSNPNLKGNRHD